MKATLILVGKNIVEQEIKRFRVDKNTNTIEKVTYKSYTRHTKLSDIQQKMTDGHNLFGDGVNLNVRKSDNEDDIPQSLTESVDYESVEEAEEEIFIEHMCRQ